MPFNRAVKGYVTLMVTLAAGIIVATSDGSEHDSKHEKCTGLHGLLLWRMNDA